MFYRWHMRFANYLLILHANYSLYIRLVNVLYMSYTICKCPIDLICDLYMLHEFYIRLANSLHIFTYDL